MRLLLSSASSRFLALVVLCRLELVAFLFSGEPLFGKVEFVFGHVGREDLTTLSNIARQKRFRGSGQPRRWLRLPPEGVPPSSQPHRHQGDGSLLDRSRPDALKDRLHQLASLLAQSVVELREEDERLLRRTVERPSALDEVAVLERDVVLGAKDDLALDELAPEESGSPRRRWTCV